MVPCGIFEYSKTVWMWENIGDEGKSKAGRGRAVVLRLAVLSFTREAAKTYSCLGPTPGMLV